MNALKEAMPASTKIFCSSQICIMHNTNFRCCHCVRTDESMKWLAKSYMHIENEYT